MKTVPSKNLTKGKGLVRSRPKKIRIPSNSDDLPTVPGAFHLDDANFPPQLKKLCLSLQRIDDLPSDSNFVNLDLVGLDVVLAIVKRQRRHKIIEEIRTELALLRLQDESARIRSQSFNDTEIILNNIHQIVEKRKETLSKKLVALNEGISFKTISTQTEDSNLSPQPGPSSQLNGNQKVKKDYFFMIETQNNVSRQSAVASSDSYSASSGPEAPETTFEARPSRPSSPDSSQTKELDETRVYTSSSSSSSSDSEIRTINRKSLHRPLSSSSSSDNINTSNEGDVSEVQPEPVLVPVPVLPEVIENQKLNTTITLDDTIEEEPEHQEQNLSSKIRIEFEKVDQNLKELDQFLKENELTNKSDQKLEHSPKQDEDSDIDVEGDSEESVKKSETESDPELVVFDISGEIYSSSEKLSTRTKSTESETFEEHLNSSPTASEFQRTSSPIKKPAYQPETSPISEIEVSPAKTSSVTNPSPIASTSASTVPRIEGNNEIVTLEDSPNKTREEQPRYVDPNKIKKVFESRKTFVRQFGNTNIFSDLREALIVKAAIKAEIVPDTESAKTEVVSNIRTPKCPKAIKTTPSITADSLKQKQRKNAQHLNPSALSSAAARARAAVASIRAAKRKDSPERTQEIPLAKKIKILLPTVPLPKEVLPVQAFTPEALRVPEAEVVTEPVAESVLTSAEITTELESILENTSAADTQYSGNGVFDLTFLEGPGPIQTEVEQTKVDQPSENNQSNPHSLLHTPEPIPDSDLELEPVLKTQNQESAKMMPPFMTRPSSNQEYQQVPQENQNSDPEMPVIEPKEPDETKALDLSTRSADNEEDLPSQNQKINNDLPGPSTSPPGLKYFVEWVHVSPTSFQTSSEILNNQEDILYTIEVPKDSAISVIAQEEDSNQICETIPLIEEFVSQTQHERPLIINEDSVHEIEDVASPQPSTSSANLKNNLSNQSSPQGSSTSNSSTEGSQPECFECPHHPKSRFSNKQAFVKHMRAFHDFLYERKNVFIQECIPCGFQTKIKSRRDEHKCDKNAYFFLKCLQPGCEQRPLSRGAWVTHIEKAHNIDENHPAFKLASSTPLLEDVQAFKQKREEKSRKRALELAAKNNGIPRPRGRPKGQKEKEKETKNRKSKGFAHLLSEIEKPIKKPKQNQNQSF